MHLNSEIQKSMSSTISDFRHGVSVSEIRKFGMTPEDLRRWLVAGLEQNRGKKSKSGLAARLGLAPSAITDMQRQGGRIIKAHQVPIIAGFLDIDPPAGFHPPALGDLHEIPQSSRQLVTKVGTVQAGTFRPVDEFDQSELETFSEPVDRLFPRARRIAFDVAGDSMNDLKPVPIPAGCEVIAVDFDDIGIPLRDGMIVVVQQERDAGFLREWSIKQVEQQDETVVFHPRSTNPVHKPIVVDRNLRADDGRTVSVLALVREIKHQLPLF